MVDISVMCIFFWNSFAARSLQGAKVHKIISGMKSLVAKDRE